MNDEIKEILQDDGELLVYYKDNSFESFDTLPKNVLNYITNLQEENERLKKEKKKLSNDLAEAILFNQKRCEQNKELKQRIDKAIKIIQNDTTLNPPRQRDRLINLLNGGDEE